MQRAVSKRLGIIGYPIRHSISPVFQQAALDHCSMDATFEAWEIDPRRLPEFITSVRSPETLGINVTVPHKEAVMSHLDSIDNWAEMAGAVNTVVNEAGKLAGHNTDGSGFLRALEEQGKFHPEGRNVLIIGAGGSAKAVALALCGRGAASITIANRTLQRAQRLVELLESNASFGTAKSRPRVEAVPLHSPEDTLERAASESELVVNCTTMGMKHGPDETHSPIPARYIPSRALVYDLVYNPPETPLLREAARAGAATLGGLPMLVYQGAAAFQLWTGQKAPVEVMMRAAQEAMSQS